MDQIFYILNTFDDFYEYLKSLSKKKKIKLKKDNNKIIIILFVEILLKQREIEIELNPTKKNIEQNLKEIYEELNKIKNLYNNIEITKKKNEEIDFIINENKKLNNDIIALKNENKELKEEIKKQKIEINNLKEGFRNIISRLNENSDIDSSSILKEDEKSLIFSSIENILKKEIKTIKRLYKASIDGGEPKCFHDKCDNIPNTLVLIKSEGLRRFGGFTKIPWKSKGDWVKDPEMKTFVFSLDKKKIYFLKRPEKAVHHVKEYGPCFGFGHDIGIEGNPIKGNHMITYQSSYDYKGDYNSLSDNTTYDNKGKIQDYEVYQIIFN